MTPAEEAQARREKYGWSQSLATVVTAPKLHEVFKKDENGEPTSELDHKNASFRVAINNKYFTASTYVKNGKPEFEKFLTGLPVGQLVSIEYVINDNGFVDIKSIFPRERKSKKADK